MWNVGFDGPLGWIGMDDPDRLILGFGGWGLLVVISVSIGWDGTVDGWMGLYRLILAL